MEQQPSESLRFCSSLFLEGSALVDWLQWETEGSGVLRKARSRVWVTLYGAQGDSLEDTSA